MLLFNSFNWFDKLPCSVFNIGIKEYNQRLSGQYLSEINWIRLFSTDFYAKLTIE